MFVHRRVPAGSPPHPRENLLNGWSSERKGKRETLQQIELFRLRLEEDEYIHPSLFAVGYLAHSCSLLFFCSLFPPQFFCASPCFVPAHSQPPALSLLNNSLISNVFLDGSHPQAAFVRFDSFTI